MALKLVDLDEAEFAAERSRMIDGFIQESAAVFGASRDNLLAEAEEQIPGRRDPRHVVCRALLDGEEIAFVWAALPGVVFPSMAWLNFIEVAGPFRGLGLGGQVLAAAEHHLAALGVTRLGLHVFGHNTPAIRLYTRHGYTLLNQIRSSRTPDPDPASAVRPAAEGETAPAPTAGPSAGVGTGQAGGPAPTGGLASAGGSAPAVGAGLADGYALAGGSASAGGATLAAGAGLAGGPASAGGGASAGGPVVELWPMTSPAREDRVADVAGNDPVALTRDPAASSARIREVAAALGATGEFRSIRVGGRNVGWLWFAEPEEHRPALTMVRYLQIHLPERRHGFGRAALAVLSAELAGRGFPPFALNIPGTHPEALAFADAIGLGVLSQQMVKDLPAAPG